MPILYGPAIDYEKENARAFRAVRAKLTETAKQAQRHALALKAWNASAQALLAAEETAWDMTHDEMNTLVSEALSVAQKLERKMCAICMAQTYGTRRRVLRHG